MDHGRRAVSRRHRLRGADTTLSGSYILLMTTRTPHDLAITVFTMTLAAEDAFKELCRVYDDIELAYKRRHQEARVRSKRANTIFAANEPLLICS